MIDAASITVGQVIDKQTVQEIPLNGRHFLDLTVLTPGGVTGPANGNHLLPAVVWVRLRPRRRDRGRLG